MKVKYFDLKNKRVFITGGGSGIGASIVELFCEQECEVYFVDINIKESKKLISHLKNILVNIAHSAPDWNCNSAIDNCPICLLLHN